jgi:hypothetical protein
MPLFTIFAHFPCLPPYNAKVPQKRSAALFYRRDGLRASLPVF